MISSNDLSTNVTIEFEGEIYVVLEFQHVLQNKTAFVRVKLKNLRTGSTVLKTINNGIKIPKAMIDRLSMTYQYNDGHFYWFMDNETYDQVPIEKKNLENELPFLVENQEVEVIQYKGETLGVNLPDKVVITIQKTDPAIKGDTKTNALKDAYLETGFLVKVPMFIEEGERVIINTNTKEYVSREK